MKVNIESLFSRYGTQNDQGPIFKKLDSIPEGINYHICVYFFKILKKIL